MDGAGRHAGAAEPEYCQDDPALARMIDEAQADPPLTGLAGRTVRQCLPERPGELPVVDPDATVLEIATALARTRSPLVAVAGAITLGALLDRM